MTGSLGIILTVTKLSSYLCYITKLIASNIYSFFLLSYRRKTYVNILDNRRHANCELKQQDLPS